ncbi:MAG TPA: hypothetical protein DD490_00555 [Acidobacteria bacterium]|nr:hypothetical protein [Acidobacteriota bacterium]
MSRRELTTGAVLDTAVDLVSRRLPGMAGLLMLASLPLRFLEAWLANRLLQLGDKASEHVSYLTGLSVWVTLSLLLAFWGRAVWARSCTLALTGGEAERRISWRERLRLSPAGLVSYLYAATVAEVLFFALGWTLVALPVLAVLGGLAAATSALDHRPGLFASLGHVLRHARPFGVLAGLTLVFLMGVPVVFLNLSMLFQILVWAAGGMTGTAGAWWEVALSWENQQFVVLACAGAILLLEPFWLAALVVAVRQARARQSGEDLAAWFAALRPPVQEEA